VIAATTPVAVLILLRRLGAEGAARRATPFLVLTPAAIWLAVSADAVFGAFAAWGLCLLACAATTAVRGRRIGWAIGAGLILGYCVMMSYGLPVLGIIALAVLVAARSYRALPWACGAAVLVVVGFAAGGFAWWQAYPVLVTRYYDGVQKNRPYAYWVWGNLGALAFSAGPIVGAAIAGAISRIRSIGSRHDEARTVTLLTLAALACVLLADLSGMSKAEVERIWLPFIPWLLLGTALLPLRLKRAFLAIQVITALLVQHLLFTGW
jgi:MFS family permease